MPSIPPFHHFDSSPFIDFDSLTSSSSYPSFSIRNATLLVRVLTYAIVPGVLELLFTLDVKPHGTLFSSKLDEISYSSNTSVITESHKNPSYLFLPSLLTDLLSLISSHSSSLLILRNSPNNYSSNFRHNNDVLIHASTISTLCNVLALSVKNLKIEKEKLFNVIDVLKTFILAVLYRITIFVLSKSPVVYPLPFRPKIYKTKTSSIIIELWDEDTTALTGNNNLIGTLFLF
jgi:hypothetical protein